MTEATPHPPAPRSPVRVVLLGFGVVGRGVTRAAAKRPGLEIAGVIVRRPELDRRPATELVPEAPPDLRLSTDGPAVLATARPDVVLVATRSSLPSDRRTRWASEVPASTPCEPAPRHRSRRPAASGESAAEAAPTHSPARTLAGGRR